KMFRPFGLDALAREQFKKRIERERTAAEVAKTDGDDEARPSRGGGAMFTIPIIELCRCSPGMVTAMGVSVGLTAAAVMSKGTIEQKERWALDLLTLDKIGAWAITEPNSGSDAFGGMQSTARRDGDEYAGGGRDAAKATFTMERTGVAAMALGIVERCLELCLDYARERVQFGKPIGEYQLIQLKVARMEVARLNLQNLVFRQIEMQSAGRQMTLAEASAGKLYGAQAATEVALEAVQLFGGNGYMAEYEVEQLARDAKVLQIYAGTDE